MTCRHTKSHHHPAAESEGCVWRKEAGLYDAHTKRSRGTVVPCAERGALFLIQSPGKLGG